MSVMQDIGGEFVLTILSKCSHVSTIVLLHYLDSKEMSGEKAR